MDYINFISNEAIQKQLATEKSQRNLELSKQIPQKKVKNATWRFLRPLWTDSWDRRRGKGEANCDDKDEKKDDNVNLDDDIQGVFFTGTPP